MRFRSDAVKAIAAAQAMAFGRSGSSIPVFA